ncbi:transposase [Microbacterium sp. NPDC057944]|uniref:transposase n=1 Tax=Microbacterium sp. NPDC057944 TaxID=3346286 RepID=UPI0036DDF6A9
MTSRDFAEMAAALYSGPPAAFVATRNALAAAAADRDAGDRIRALKKPSVSAWVVNLFARERPSQLGEALQLAQELRDAQADLDAATLATLGRERRALTQRLAAEATSLASARGERITPATSEAVRQTLTAAFFDPDAAAAVASGRLIRELEPSAPVDLESVVAGGVSDTAPAPVPPLDEVRARRMRRDAERAVNDAEKALAHAEQQQHAAQRSVRDAEALTARLPAQIEELETELARMRDRLIRATADASAAQALLDTATSDVVSAAEVLSASRQRLNEL